MTCAAHGRRVARIPSARPLPEPPALTHLRCNALNPVPSFISHCQRSLAPAVPALAQAPARAKARTLVRLSALQLPSSPYTFRVTPTLCLPKPQAFHNLMLFLCPRSQGSTLTLLTAPHRLSRPLDACR